MFSRAKISHTGHIVTNFKSTLINANYFESVINSKPNQALSTLVYSPVGSFLPSQTFPCVPFCWATSETNARRISNTFARLMKYPGVSLGLFTGGYSISISLVSMLQGLTSDLTESKKNPSQAKLELRAVQLSMTLGSSHVKRQIFLELSEFEWQLTSEKNAVHGKGSRRWFNQWSTSKSFFLEW